MIAAIRGKLSYANVMATLAVGGGWALASGKIGSSDVKNHSLKLVDMKQIQQKAKEVGVSASENDPGLAEAEAKDVTIAKHGPFKIYGKCWKDSDDDYVYANEYISTKKDGARMMSYEGNQLMGSTGSTYLNTDTPQPDRNIDDAPSAGDGYVGDPNHFNNFEVFSGGANTYWHGWVRGIPKNGPLPEGDHGWKPGDRCLFVYGSTG